MSLAPGDGLIKLDLGHDRVSMLQDRILILDDEGNGFDAPGNLGTGKRSFAELQAEELVLLTLYAKAKTDNLTGPILKEIRRALEN